MRIHSTMLALALSLAAVAAAPAFAASSTTAAKPMTAQQQKMATCSTQSKGMKGDAHKQFMSDCLKGKTTTASTASTPAASTGKMSQQDKMKACNTDANGKKLKGTERKSYMSTCLKGSGTPATAH